MKFKLLNVDKQKTFAIILESGEEVMQCIQSFAQQQNLKASQLSAIGAFSKASLGFFDFDIKDYKKIEVNEQVEVLNVAGDISLYNNEIKIHAHVVLGKKDGAVCGGHLLKATVHPTLEIILTESPSFLKREMDKNSHIPLIKI